MKTWRKWLTPPVFEDEVKTEQAYLLHVIVWALICVPIPYVIYSLVFTPETAGRAVSQMAFGETVNLILLVMLRRGYVRAASVIQVGAFWFFFTASAVTSSGVQGESYLLGYGLVIAAAGMLLGSNGAFIFTFLSLISGGLMVYGTTQGWIASGFDNSALSTWVVSLVLFPVGALLQHLGMRSTRRALARARSSEEKYRLISRVSSDYTFSTELDEQGNMRLNWATGAFEAMTGYTYEDYVAHGGWYAHLHPDDAEKDARALANLKANRQVIHEVRTYTRDHQIQWVRVYAHPVWDENKNALAGIVGAVQDITERKQAEEALKAERDLLQLLMDNIPDTIYFKDRESRFVRINQAQADFLKLHDPQAAIGKTDRDFQPPELVKEILEEESRIIQTGQPVYNRIELGPAEGDDPRWFSATRVPLRDATGQTIGILGISRDVTGQKRSEAREAERRASLEKIVKLGQHVAEVQDLYTALRRIWHSVRNELGFDRVGIYLYNPELDAMDGTYGTDHQGKMLDEWHNRVLLHDTTVETVAFKTTLNHANGIYYSHDYENEHGIKPGHIMEGVKEHAAVAAWTGDKPVAVICVDNVITGRPIKTENLEALRLFAGYAGLAIENARLKTALELDLKNRKALIEELESKNAELERFTYTVSHDLKSPLVTITGFLGYLEQDAAAGNMQRIKGNINRIAAAAGKMQALLNDLLELSRIGRLINPPEDVPFTEIVHEAVDRVRGPLDETNAIVEIQTEMPVVRGDRIRLVEVIQNLIENAVKYSNPKARTRIEIGAEQDMQNSAVFFVRDNGIGIAREYHETIFGLFNKLDPAIEGTGIGLTLVKRIIEVHGGRIWVESEPGKGAAFHFTIPTNPIKE